MMSSRLHCRRAPPPMDLSAHLQGWQNVNASGISLNVSTWRRWKINSKRKSFFGKEGRTCFGLLTNFSRQRKTSKDFCKPFPPWISRPVQLITCIAVLWNCADSNWNPQRALHVDDDIYIMMNVCLSVTKNHHFLLPSWAPEVQSELSTRPCRP